MLDLTAILTRLVGNKRLKIYRTKEDSLLDNLVIDENGKVALYDAFDIEKRPHLAVYHPSFKDAKDLINNMCKNFLRVEAELGTIAYHNKNVRHITILTNNIAATSSDVFAVLFLLGLQATTASASSMDQQHHPSVSRRCGPS